jgi:hypothetical protein
MKDKKLAIPYPNRRDLQLERDAHEAVRDSLNNDLLELYAVAKKVAMGEIDEVRTAMNGGEYVYTNPPDPKMLMYLMDRALGKTPTPRQEVAEAVKPQSLDGLLDELKLERSKIITVRAVTKETSAEEPIIVEKRKEDERTAAATRLGIATP